MKNNKIYYGTNANLGVKFAVLLASLLMACLFGKKSSKKKKNGVFYRTAKNYNSLNGLANAFYLNKLKKQTNPDDFPVKMETAEIIDI